MTEDRYASSTIAVHGHQVPADGHVSSTLMNAERRQFLEELLLTPSPTGNERAIQRLIRDRMADVAESG